MHAAVTFANTRPTAAGTLAQPLSFPLLGLAVEPPHLPWTHQQARRLLSSSSSAASNQSSSNASSGVSLEDDVVVTNQCIRRIKALQANTGKQDLKLRLSVEGGGCSGFTYSFTMEEGPLQEDDRVFGREGGQLVIDEGSLEFVKGATVDFTEDMMRSAFAVVNNPLSESACGCGSSFAVKNFEKNPAID
ncbi:iron-sulfur cluster assembly 2 mitochondrial-like [Nannochloropsis oceanica]